MDKQFGSTPDKSLLADPSNSVSEKIAYSRVPIFLDRIIFYSLLGLIALAATPYGIVSPWRGAIETVFECGVFVLCILWMIEGMLSRVWVSRQHQLLLPLLFMTALAFAQTLPLGSSSRLAGISASNSAAISFDPYETWLMIFKLLAYALALGLLLRYTSSRGRLRILIFFVIGIGVMSAMFALLRQTTQHGTPEFLFPFVRLDRGYGQFVNRNHFAFLMEMALGLALGLIAGGVVRRDRGLIYLSAAIPIWVALVLSNSRGGILSMLCQLLLMAVMFGIVRTPKGLTAKNSGAASGLAKIGNSNFFRLTLGASLLAASLVGIVWIGGEQIVSRFETMEGEVAVETQESNPGARRKDIWSATWQMIKHHPVTGVGIGGYWTAFPQYHVASGRVTPQQAHNDYLELLASAGVIGILLGAWYIFLLVKFARQRLRAVDPFRRAACFGALTGLFGIAIHSLVDFGLHIPINALICLMLVAIATVHEDREVKKLDGIEHSD